MNISEISLQRPVLAIVISIVIVLFGAIAFNFLGVREYPAIDPPTISVSTRYTGASAEVIESQITEPLEKAINGIAGIKSITSNSTLGVSNITVEFNLSSGLEQAANDVRDKVSQAVRNLPQDIDAPPVVTKADANSDPILFMPIQSTTRNMIELSDYAENVLQERLQTIPGVSQVQIFGQRRAAMRLWIDPVRLAAYSLTIQDIKSTLDRENVELPGGKVRGNSTELTVNSFGRLATEDDFNNLIVKQSESQIIRFRDVGEAILGAENEETLTRKNGYPVVSLAIIAQPGANHIQIADEFYRRMEILKKDMPSDIVLDIGIDKSRFVRRAVNEVEETLLIAIGLVVLIVYFFFRDWIIAFRPLIDIPISLIGAFFIMYIAGFSINVLTLLAIVLATGLVVDDGIVVTENIFKKMEGGMSKFQAAREGTREIFFAVISTSITLAIVFLPVIFLQGFVGSLFREFGLVLAGAVLISAFVSLTITPVLNVKLSRDVHHQTRFYKFTEPFFSWLDNKYRSMLTGFMKRRWLAFVLVGVCLAAIVFVGTTIQSELAPLEDRAVIRSPITAQEGTDFDAMEKLVGRIAQTVQDSVGSDARIVFSNVAPAFGNATSTNSGGCNIFLKDPQDRKRSQKEIAQQLARIYKKFPEARVIPIQEQTISVGFRVASQLPVQFIVQNLNFQRLREVLPKFMEECSKSPILQGVDVDLKFNKPELRVTIDRLKATELGVSVLDVANTLQFALSGRRFGYFLMNGKQYQIIGQVDRNNRDEPLDLASYYVRNNKGTLIQLDNIVHMEETSSPPSLYHYNRFKSATISAGLAPGKTIGDGVKEMQAIAARILDESFTTALSGASRDYAESSSNTSFAFILALVLIYLTLAAQFESFRDPFIIMITVPLALAGAVLSLMIFGQTLNIFSEIGIIMLIGLVTKNGILIVEFANQQRHNGLEKTEAVIAASSARLRPILMTSLATILGALPIALSLGAGSQSRIPLGVVIVGGLLFALVLTLFVIPAMYSFIARKKLKQQEE
ncbi:MAG: efflux RND transporter permease subunit [Candidatus Kapaibacterium sp.]